MALASGTSPGGEFHAIFAAERVRRKDIGGPSTPLRMTGFLGLAAGPEDALTPAEGGAFLSQKRPQHSDFPHPPPTHNPE